MNFGILFIFVCIIIQYCVCLDRSIASNTRNALNISGSSVDDMNLIALLNQGRKFKSKTSEIFMRMYGEKPVEITDISTPMVWNNRLLIDHSLAERFLSVFGDLIKSLAIKYVSIPVFRHKEIGNFVNFYCSETLLEFEVNDCSEGAFDGMQTPFKKVESVIFNGVWEKLSNKSLGSNQLFPEMRYLTLVYSNGYILDENYPKLIELNLNAPNSNLLRLLQSNPQIQKMTVRDCSTNFLKMLNDKLPKLEFISFDVPYDLDQYNGTLIKFDSVKYASIYDLSGSFKSDKFHFKNLENFELLVEEDVNSEWALFMASLSGQKSLIISISNFTENVLPNLPLHLNSSIEVRLGCNLIEIEPLANFLNSNKELKTLVLKCSKNSQSFFKDLDYRLDDEWKMVPVNNSKRSSILTTMDIAQDQKEVTTDQGQEVQTVTEPLFNSTENAINNTTEPSKGTNIATSFPIEMSIFTLVAAIMNTIF
ncbi:uncharacterized protein LOC129568759 [Sitodiplosis mosellana]|uniref:uncharacterized protein LOC129568759 n=1 Tax=Sitodiplosis mosellana TaxID=263140 RepID=UPI002443FE54|nr:uncharacterized protein LOC129568759 [Sitodiplosis mosellana]XP_055303006.1 uncharacterized protein LOC129568759 [Sitodiplosis mosellana]XP_055303015.1 uncharacterized protein LOC129568759 [Sitodiplosis mosellana]